MSSLSSLITIHSLLTLHSTSKDLESSLLETLSRPIPLGRANDVQSSLVAQLSHLRALHRQTTSLIRSTKAKTSSSRSEVDSLHLVLQNLQYEQDHLRTEIDSCEGYAHPYTDLPIESLETFLSTHPELVEADEETLTVARIARERQQREELEARRLELVKRKQVLQAENKKRREDLQKLDVEMEAFIDAAKKIEKTLGVDEDVVMADGASKAGDDENMNEEGKDDLG